MEYKVYKHIEDKELVRVALRKVVGKLFIVNEIDMLKRRN